MTTEDDFRAALAVRPDDHQTRLVFADWLDEHDDQRAAGYRAMGTLGIRPHILRVDEPNYEPVRPHPDMCQWGAADAATQYVNDPRYKFAILPRVWFDLVAVAPFVHDGHDHNASPTYWKVFATTREAEDAAAVAFAALPPELRLAIMNPTAKARRRTKK